MLGLSILLSGYDLTAATHRIRAYRFVLIAAVLAFFAATIAADRALAQTEDTTSESIESSSSSEEPSSSSDAEVSAEESEPLPTEEEPLPEEESGAAAASMVSEEGEATGDSKPKDRAQSSTGTFEYSLPIAVPGFRGLEPSLAFSYNSSTINSDLGHGWSLSGLSAIERATMRDGAPLYDNSKDIFLLDGEEVFVCPTSGATGASCTAGGTHTTEFESFLRIKRVNSGGDNYWEVTSTDGTKLTYRPPATWTSYNTGDPNEVKEATDFRWLLAEAKDTHNNTVTHAYSCTGVPDCDIDTITYNGNSIKFHWDTRPDPIVYATGVGIGSAGKRLKSVEIKVGTSLLHAYKVTYRAPVAGVGAAFRSRVTDIQEFGRNATVTSNGDVSGGLSLPPTTFGYSGDADVASGATRFQNGSSSSEDQRPVFAADFDGDGKSDQATGIAVSMWNGTGLAPVTWPATGTNLPGAQDKDFVMMPGDFNGDGRADIAATWKDRRLIPGGDGDYDFFTQSRIFVSTGSGFGSGINLPFGLGGSFSQYWVADVTGDGRDDFVFKSNGCSLAVDRATGTGFAQETWPVSGCTTALGALQVADLNGDGKSDFISSTGVAGGFSVRVSTGSNSTGFVGGFWPIQFAAGEPSSAVGEAWHRGDFNGDGKTDIIHVWNGASGANARVYLSTGSGFVGQSLLTSLLGASPMSVVFDANGDGRSDVLLGSSTPLRVLLSSGSGFVSQAYSNTTLNGNLKLSKADFNGDGLEEYMGFWVGAGQNNGEEIVYPRSWTAYKTNGAVSDLLTSITESLGGSTTIAYTPSSAWPEANLAYPNANLANAMQTVSSLTIGDGRGDSSTTTYSYTAPVWNAEQRRFLGFGTARATLPCNAGEAACPRIDYTFLRDPKMVTRIDTVEVRDGAGTLMAKTDQDYSTPPSTFPYVSTNVASWNYVYSGASSKSSKTTRIYDFQKTPPAYFGNIVEETNHGDLGRTGDEITVITEFNSNATAYIVDAPARVLTYAGVGAAGTQLAESRSYYDGAAAYTTPPARGDVTKSEALRVLPSTFIASLAAYDTYGNVTSTTDPVGGVTTTIYDTTYHLFPTEVRDPLYGADSRHKVLTGWDVVCGLPLTVTDMNGQVTTNTYDNLCRPTRTQSPNGNFTFTTYNNIGTATTQNIRTVTPKPGATTMPADGDAANLFAETYMDGLGRTYRTVAKGPTNIETLTTFTKRGAVASQTAPFYSGGNQYPTTWTYDALDRKIERLHPDDGPPSEKVTGAYGLSSITNGFQTVTVTDELSRPATVHTDAYGRTIRSDRKLGAATVSTHYQYDLLGRLLGITDNAGNQWSYDYDLLGRRLAANDPDLGNWTYVYDDAGRLLDQKDAKNQHTVLTYDALGRVKTKTSPAGTTTYTYDEARAGYYNVGHLTTAANSAGTIRYDHDKDGRQVRQQYVVDGTTHTITDTLDIGGRLLSRAYPDGDTVGTITYDAAGRLKTVPSLVTDTLYDARSQVTSIVRQNAVNSTYSYSTHRGWLTGMSTVKSSTTLQNYGYTRDARGRITGVTSSQAGEGWIYGYDDMDRLTSADNNTPDNSLDQTWTYDSVDNMLTNSLVGTYSYPAPGSARPHAVTGLSGGPLGTQSFTYDDNGSMTNQAGDTRTYDGENRLVTAVDGATTTQFVYGPDGARLKKIVGATTTLYLGADIEKTSGTWTKYLPGDARKVGTSGYKWMHRDHLQSVRLETDSAGAIATGTSSQYRPFGERVPGTATLTEAKGFIGERHDIETGLIYLNARYYDSVLGRFVSADPSDPTVPGVGVNRYAYALNSPIVLLDPSGFVAKDNYANEHGLGPNGSTGSFAQGSLASGSIGHGSIAGTDGQGNLQIYDERRLRQLYREGRLDDRWNDTIEKALGPNPAADGARVPGGLTIEQAMFAVFGGGALTVAGEAITVTYMQHNFPVPANPGAYGQTWGEWASMMQAQSTQINRNDVLARVTAAVATGSMNVYRVWGGLSGPWGMSWTNVDPRTIPDYRNVAGLPDQNTGQFLSEGVLTDPAGVTVKLADPLHGNIGGLVEVVVPNPPAQIGVTNVVGLNPPF
jgi:RHS repeat-associated protein